MPYQISTDQGYWLNSTYKIIAIGWNRNGEPWPFMTTSARAGSIAFSGTVVSNTTIPDYKIASNNTNEPVFVSIEGDDQVTEGQTAIYTIYLKNRDGSPYNVTQNTNIYIGYFVGYNAEMSDINPVDQVMIGSGSNSTVLALTTNNVDEQLNLYRTIDVSVLDIDRTGIDLVDLISATKKTIIRDSEPKPTISFLTESQSTTEQNATLTITITPDVAPTEYDIRIPLIISGTAGSHDYSISNDEEILLPIGSNSVSINVNIISDVYLEPDETIIVTMGIPEYGILGGITEHTITILGEPSVSLDEALGIDGVEGISVSTRSPWRWWGQTGGVGNGSDTAARPAAMSRYERSYLDIIVDGFGELKFDWKTGEYVTIYYHINNVEQPRKNGNSDWTTSVSPIFSNDRSAHAELNYYSSSGNASTGNSWVDNMTWRPGNILPLGTALNNLELTFTTEGSRGGFIGQDILGWSTPSGAAAINLSGGEQASLKTSVDGPESNIVFDWGFIDNVYGNFLKFLVDGVEEAATSDNDLSDNTSETISIPLATGSHDLEWKYITRNSDSNESVVTPIIDNIRYTPS